MTTEHYDQLIQWFSEHTKPPPGWSPIDGPIELTASFHRAIRRFARFKPPRSEQRADVKALREVRIAHRFNGIRNQHVVCTDTNDPPFPF